MKSVKSHGRLRLHQLRESSGYEFDLPLTWIQDRVTVRIIGHTTSVCQFFPVMHAFY